MDRMVPNSAMSCLAMTAVWQPATVGRQEPSRFSREAQIELFTSTKTAAMQKHATTLKHPLIRAHDAPCRVFCRQNDRIMPVCIPFGCSTEDHDEMRVSS